MDESEEEHEEHDEEHEEGHDDHEGLTLGNFMQQNAEFEARAAKEAVSRKNHQMDILK